MNRETWLNMLADKMAPKFAELGWPLQPFRVAIGFTSGGKSSKADGECWHKSRSADGRFEILISIGEAEAMQVAAILAHELTHAAAGFKHGHKGDFAKCMAALGMVRPFTTSTPGDEFKAWAQPFLAELGELPHAALAFGSSLALRAPREDGEGEGGGEDDEGGSSNQKPKQKTRMLKCTCRECGYTVRTTLKWVEVGAPHCPNHGAMDVDAGAMADAPQGGE